MLSIILSVERPFVNSEYMQGKDAKKNRKEKNIILKSHIEIV